MRQWKMQETTEREPVFKYHGLGNDFLILDRRRDGRDIDDTTAQQLCDRRRGIGADGALVLLPSGSAAARMIVHNSDGSTAEMCGNGIRCVVKYLVDGSTEKPPQVRVDTAVGILLCDVTYRDGEVDQVQVSMGPARLVADNLPSKLTGTSFVGCEVPGFPDLRGTAISMGNPHLVLFGCPLDEAARFGPELERNGAFPERTNVGFAHVREGGMQLRVWERGAGLTQACGTGACAAVAAAVVEKRLPPGRWIPVSLPGGVLEVRSEADLSNLQMRGPATFVFEGFVSLPRLVR